MRAEGNRRRGGSKGPLSALRVVARRVCLSALLLGVVPAALIVSVPAVAFASKPDVRFTEVIVPDGPKAKQQQKLLRQLLTGSAKRAKFGKAKHVRMRAEVTTLTHTETDGVLKVRCTMVGRIEGGRQVRSHLEFGGKPERRAELEKKVLWMVADGLVTRLAQMARDRAEAEASAPPAD